MLSLNYTTLANAYRHYAALGLDEYFATLGWSDKAGSPGYVRNGAVLTSLALLSSSVHLNGPLTIEAGPFAGRKVQYGANRLAGWLAERHTTPETLSLTAGMGVVAGKLFGRRGILAFTQGTGPNGGSIVLLDGRNAAVACTAAERIHPLEVRFWAIS
jgi:hypothetical protein